MYCLSSTMKFYLFLSASFLIHQTSLSVQLDPVLSPQEIKWLNENKHNIKYAPNPTWRPTDYIDDEGIHRGIVSDYIKIIEEKLNISMEYSLFPDWSSLLNGLRQGKADFVGAIQSTVEREEFLLFTDPYLQIPVVILVRNDYPHVISDNSIYAMTLSGVKDYASIEFVKNKFPETTILEYKDDLSALVQTSLGNTDGTVIDLLTASHLVEEYGITNLALGYTLDYNWEIRFACRKEIPELNSILNKLLKTIDENQRSQIYSKWVKIDNIRPESFLERNQDRLILLSLMIMILFAASVLYVLLLKRQVAIRTVDLKTSNERYLYATKASFDAIWDMDLISNKLFLGEGFSTLFGHNIGQAETSHVFSGKKIHPEDRQRISESLWKALNSDNMNWKENYRYAKSSGEYAYVQDKAVIMRDAKGRATRVIGAIQDVTERKKYIDAIENQNIQLREIAYTQSHIVRAPLARIMGLVNLINVNSENPQTELLEYVRSSAHELDDVIRSIVRKTESIDEKLNLK